MANFALLIGVDAYMSESRLTSLRSAADAARQMARWLIAENWVVPEQTRLLCAPHDAERGEWPATRSSIAAALGELKRAGAQATPADRLYLLFAGYSAGHFDEQRLLLPHDTDTARLGEQAVPLAALTRWLRGTGFQTQLCMLALANAGVAVTAEALFEARLPESLTTATASWPEVSQVHLLGLGEARVGTAGELPAMFSAVLHKGLAGAARVSIDHETGERVIRLGALRAYLERENAPGDASDWRCITTGRSPC